MMLALHFYIAAAVHVHLHSIHPPITHTLTTHTTHTGADPFVRDQEGRSPLDIAARSGNPAMVQAVSSAMRTQLVSACMCMYVCI